MIIIGQVPKNQKEVVRVCIAEYRGQQQVDVRVCWQHDGEYLFTKRGVTIKPEHTSQIIDLLQKARNELAGQTADTGSEKSFG